MAGRGPRVGPIRGRRRRIPGLGVHHRPAARGQSFVPRGCNAVRTSDDWEGSMERFAIDADTVERLLNGALTAEDAPHRFGEVAALLHTAALPTSSALDGEAAAVESVVEA